MSCLVGNTTTVSTAVAATMSTTVRPGLIRVSIQTPRVVLRIVSCHDGTEPMKPQDSRNGVSSGLRSTSNHQEPLHSSDPFRSCVGPSLPALAVRSEPQIHTKRRTLNESRNSPCFSLAARSKLLNDSPHNPQQPPSDLGSPGTHTSPKRPCSTSSNKMQTPSPTPRMRPTARMRNPPT